VAAQLGSYYVLLGGGQCTQKDARVESVQSWSVELADQGYQQTGEGGHRFAHQVAEITIFGACKTLLSSCNQEQYFVLNARGNRKEASAGHRLCRLIGPM